MSARCTGKAGTLRSRASAGADKAGHGVNTSALTSRLAVRPTPAATQGGLMHHQVCPAGPLQS
jgi:hypothetical protein